ncbi:arginyltransferase [soil metagenome]
MTIERRNFPQFFITAPAKCPYLSGHIERKVFTHLIGTEARPLNSQLSQAGFRRSQNIAYRPACDGCSACVSVRVRVQEFNPGESFRRIARRNRDVASTVRQPKATGEQYSLFRSYIDERHADGGMADMTVIDFAAMIDDSFVDSRIVEYRVGNSEGTLIACVLTDVLNDGLSMIYSFYDPDSTRRSLGTFMILDHIERAKRLGLPYLYLGYWVQGSQKMSYKARFLPQERLTMSGWSHVDL